MIFSVRRMRPPLHTTHIRFRNLAYTPTYLVSSIRNNILDINLLVICLRQVVEYSCSIFVSILFFVGYDNE